MHQKHKKPLGEASRGLNESSLGREVDNCHIYHGKMTWFKNCIIAQTMPTKLGVSDRTHCVLARNLLMHKPCQRGGSKMTHGVN
jgi:hypothetical protein